MTSRSTGQSIGAGHHIWDTTARRMGGVAGHAGVFSTAHDVGIFAQAVLDRLAGRASAFPLAQATVQLMTAPEQPGPTPTLLRGYVEQCTDFRVELVDGVGQWIAEERPTLVLDRLRHFFERCGTRPRQP